MTIKRAAFQAIRKMPADATLAAIMAELYFRLKVDAGLRELDQGKGVPHAEAKKRLWKWLG